MLTTIARYTAFLVRSLMCLELKIAFRSAPNAPAADDLILKLGGQRRPKLDKSVGWWGCGRLLVAVGHTSTCGMAAASLGAPYGHHMGLGACCDHGQRSVAATDCHVHYPIGITMKTHTKARSAVG